METLCGQLVNDGPGILKPEPVTFFFLLLIPWYLEVKNIKESQSALIHTSRVNS